jgi:hypothetical protein
VNDVSQTQSLRLQAVQLSSGHDPSTELVLLSASPNVDMTSGGERKNVILSTGHLDDLDLGLGESRKSDRSELEWRVARYAVETKDTFVTLPVSPDQLLLRQTHSETSPRPNLSLVVDRYTDTVTGSD